MLAWIRRLFGPRDAPRGRSLGRAGEKLAAAHLRRSGFRVLARNIIVAPGEADIVCLAPDRSTVVIVEVKTRLRRAEDPRALPPEANIHAHKRRKLIQVTKAIARRYRTGDRPIRIDVVAVEWDAEGRHIVRHHVGAVKGRHA